MNTIVSINTHWQRLPQAHLASRLAPDLPGLYAYGEVVDILGLPAEIRWAYVGRTSNLSRRLAEHESPREPNLALRQWLRSGLKQEVWYRILQPTTLRSLEADLIRALTPPFNTIQPQLVN